MTPVSRRSSSPGSYIRGTPLDAGPARRGVFAGSAGKNRGAPTALEFAKSLTISGPVTGESYYFGGPTLTGSVTYNLRNLGSDKTLIPAERPGAPI